MESALKMFAVGISVSLVVLWGYLMIALNPNPIIVILSFIVLATMVKSFLDF